MSSHKFIEVSIEKKIFFAWFIVGILFSLTRPRIVTGDFLNYSAALFKPSQSLKSSQSVFLAALKERFLLV
ncbi:MAG: hypothetical protein PVH84_11040 [Candidatus Aminicenantes bacterium]|jgi:hypothetical protein